MAAITSVAFFADRIAQGLARDAHQLLGADLVLVADQPWPGELAAELDKAGVQRAQAINFISMASAKESTLAGVKAVSENYPLRGRLRTAPALGMPDAPAERGPAPGTVWLEERLVTALQAPVGSRVKLGRAEFTVAAVLTLEPERSTNFFNIAPRLMMNLADVPATALIQTGSRVSYYLYAAGSVRSRSSCWKIPQAETRSAANASTPSRPDAPKCARRSIARSASSASPRCSPRCSPAWRWRSAPAASSSGTSTAAR